MKLKLGNLMRLEPDDFIVGKTYYDVRDFEIIKFLELDTKRVNTGVFEVIHPGTGSENVISGKEVGEIVNRYLIYIKPLSYDEVTVTLNDI